MRRHLAAVLAAGLLLAACTGGDDDPKQSLPLPEKPPSARGPATGPALEAKVLLAAADDLESALGGEDSQVDRRAGAFISGKTAVGYSVDDISGYDLESGEELWSAQLDMGGGTVCFASQPDRDVKQFTVVYGKEGFCSGIATISVADGAVLSEAEALDLTGSVDGEETSGGPISSLVTVETTDFLVDNSGDVWKRGKGQTWGLVTQLEDSSYFNLYPTPDGTKLIGSRLSSRPTCTVDAYELPSFEPIWSTDVSDLFPEAGPDCVISLATGNPAWMTLQEGSVHHMVQVDPDSGKVVGRTKTDAASDQELPKGTFDASVGSLFFDTTLGLPDGDMIFAQSRGISRYSLADDTIDWSLDLTQFELESDDDYPTTRVLPQGLTPDGYLVATVSNDTAAELVAVETKTGELVGRWAIPSEYRNGFQTQPHLTLFDDGVVLTRNFDGWRSAFGGASGVSEPEGHRYDIGVFTFPDPDAKQKTSVPTAGPNDVDATWRGGLKAAKVEDDSLTAEAAQGKVFVARGSSYVALSVTGKQLWSADLPPGSRVCSASDVDAKSTVATVVYKGADERAECRSAVRIGLKTGTMSKPVVAEKGAEEFFDVITHEGKDYITSADGRVDSVTKAGLQQVADVGLGYTWWLKTPEDPSLVIASEDTKDGKDSVIDAYRLPDFEKVWSTKASKVFGSKLDPDNYLGRWEPNGLWMTTTFGDISASSDSAHDVIAHLDATTGKVAWSTGKVKRDYLAEDPKKLIAHAALYTYGAAFDDGSMVVEQPTTVARLSPDGQLMWSTDISSIRNSLEREREDQRSSEEYLLVNQGKTVLVTLSNGTSAEFLTLDAVKGTITGRWNVPVKHRNGLQTGAEAVAVKGGVALVHGSYGWQQEFGPNGKGTPPKTTRYDLGLFELRAPGSDD